MALVIETRVDDFYTNTKVRVIKQVTNKQRVSNKS